METLDYILKKYNIEKDKYISLPISRDELTSLFKELNFKIGVEVGVERGEYSKILCESNPGLKLYCVDAWTVHRGYKDHTNQDKLNKYKEETVTRLSPYDCTILNEWSMEAVKNFEDESIDFVYIDGNHNFQNATNDIIEWSKKVKKGGIVSGHDYVKSRSSIDCQVKAVVDALSYAYKIRPIFLTNDTFTTWFFIKQ